MQSVRGVLDTTFCDKVCQWLAAGLWFSAGPPVSSTNKTDPHNITEILLKVVLNTIKPKPTIVPLEGHIGLTVYFLQFFLFTFTGQKFFLSEIFPCKLHIKSLMLKKFPLKSFLIRFSWNFHLFTSKYKCKFLTSQFSTIK